MNRTGLILASGRGSRMGDVSQPKQLLKLPDGTPIIRRVAEELAPRCSAMFCTIRSELDAPLFEAAFQGITPQVELYVKESAGEYVELAEIVRKIRPGNVIQTNGDLIFPTGVVARFVEQFGDSARFVMGREGNPQNRKHLLDIVNSRISVVPTNILALFGTRTFAARSRIFVEIVQAFIAGRVVSVPTLFNIDTPQDYESACLRLSEAGNEIQS